MLVRIPREFRVDGKPDRFTAFDGQLDRELHALRAARLRGNVLGVLVGRENVPQNRTELDFAQDAARFHIREHTLEIAHPRGDVLHVAKTAIHRLELAAHLLERCAQTVVEGRGELLVHGRANRLELSLVVASNGSELCVDRFTHLVQALLDRRAVLLEILRDLATRLVGLLELSLVVASNGSELCVDRFTHLVQALLDRRAVLLEILRDLATRLVGLGTRLIDRAHLRVEMLLFDDRGAGCLVKRRLRRREHLGEHGLDRDERLICARHLLARLIHARTAALEPAMCAHLHHDCRGRAHRSRNGSQRRNQRCWLPG